MSGDEWAAAVHAELDALCDTTVSLTSGLARVDSFYGALEAHYEIDDALLDQSSVDDCVASIKADLSLS